MPWRWPGLRSAPERRQHRAVAVLHAVAAGPRQVVGEERVGAAVEARQLAEDRDRLADDLLDVPGEGLGVDPAAVVVQGDAQGLRALALLHREAVQREGPHFGGAVHQVVQVGGGEDQRVVGGEELRRHLPGLARRRHELDAGGARLQPLGPHQRRRHVQVAVGGIDGQVGAVDAIAEDAVADHHRAVVAGHVPLVQAGPHRGERLALAVGDPDVEDVLGKFVQGVAARRRAAHPHLQRAGRDVGERGVHLHPAVFGLRERNAVADGGLRPRHGGRGQHGQRGAGRAAEEGHGGIIRSPAAMAQPPDAAKRSARRIMGPRRPIRHRLRGPK